MEDPSKRAESPPPAPKKEKFFRGPRPLSKEERKYAYLAFGLAIGGVVAFLIQMVYFTVVYTLSDWLTILIYWIVFIMPGYAADAGMLIWGGGKPIDGGRVDKQGRRLLGPGKTWRGSFLGPIGFGIPLALFVHWILFLNWPLIVAMAQGFLNSPTVVYKFYETNPEKLISDLALYMLGDPTAVNPGDAKWQAFWLLLPRIILCAFGAPVGDLVKSFIKRRLGKDRGAPWIPWDQLDFVFGCLLMAGWFVFSSYNIHVLIMTLLITPTITVVANSISYVTGHKKVPW